MYILLIYLSLLVFLTWDITNIPGLVCYTLVAYFLSVLAPRNSTENVGKFYFSKGSPPQLTRGGVPSPSVYMLLLLVNE